MRGIMMRIGVVWVLIATPVAALSSDSLPVATVPGGRFVMGDAAGEADEAPRAENVGSFSLVTTEVTNA